MRPSPVREHLSIARSDGSATYPRKVSLTQAIDSQGNAVSLGCDSQLRLTALTDATAGRPPSATGVLGPLLLITAIIDPFSRSASLTYHASGPLSSIADMLGLTSSFTYDSSADRMLSLAAADPRNARSEPA